ncbi:MAG: hypothetical protein OER86_11065, partial [Phycisphaerae bacterium]|nr:hypothetical protein [Phycisphaerae bacterium]
RAASAELNDLARAATVSRREHRREHVEQVHTRHTNESARGGRARDRRIAPGRPFGPEREGRHRRWNLTLLGCALLVGLVLPVIVPAPSGTTVNFFNFEALAQSGVPVVLKILLLYPLLAGIGVILLGRLAPHPWRGLAIVGLGVLPLLIGLCDGQLRRAMADGISQMAAGAGLAGLLLLTGLLGLLVGTRGRWYRPRMMIFFALGLVGGGCALIYQVLPVLPADAGKVPVVAIFKKFSASVPLALGDLMQLLCLLGCSILCFANTPGRKPINASQLGWMAWVLLVLAAALPLVLGMIAGVAEAGDNLTAPVFFGIVSMVAKVILLVGVILLLVPTGLIDLLIGPTDREPAAHA